MKSKVLFLGLVFSLLVCFVNLIAEEGRGDGPQKRRFEVAAMAGLAFQEGSTALGSLNLGWLISPVFEIEPNVIFTSGDAIISLNLDANISTGSKLVPYLSAGAGFCIHGAFLFNAGGGLKYGIANRLSFRGELKFYSFTDEGGTSTGGIFLAGISYSL